MQRLFSGLAILIALIAGGLFAIIYNGPIDETSLSTSSLCKTKVLHKRCLNTMMVRSNKYLDQEHFNSPKTTDHIVIMGSSGGISRATSQIHTGLDLDMNSHCLEWHAKAFKLSRNTMESRKRIHGTHCCNRCHQQGILFRREI